MFSFKSIRLPALTGLLLAVFSVQAVATAGNEISLDGTWEIVFDHENIGREAEWQDGTNFSDLKQKREVTVPSAWELIEKDYEGVAFYRREFDVPTEWKDKVVQLQFGAVKSWQYKGQLKSGVSQLLKEKINTRDLQGTYTVFVTMVDTLRNAITRNDYQIEVFSQRQLQVPDTRIAVLDIKVIDSHEYFIVTPDVIIVSCATA